MPSCKACLHLMQVQECQNSLRWHLSVGSSCCMRPGARQRLVGQHQDSNALLAERARLYLHGSCLSQQHSQPSAVSNGKEDTLLVALGSTQCGQPVQRCSCQGSDVLCNMSAMLCLVQEFDLELCLGCQIEGCCCQCQTAAHAAKPGRRRDLPSCIWTQLCICHLGCRGCIALHSACTNVPTEEVPQHFAYLCSRVGLKLAPNFDCSVSSTCRSSTA